MTANMAIADTDRVRHFIVVVSDTGKENQRRFYNALLPSTSYSQKLDQRQSLVVRFRFTDNRGFPFCEVR